MGLEFATRCIYGNHDTFEKDGTGSIVFPIYQTATYAHPEVGRSTGFDYSRLQNPTREQLEKVVASLEKGVDIAVRYGYHRWNTEIMLTTVALIIILFQLFQTIGMIISKKVDHRN